MNEIFRILENDARTTPQQIATMTGIPIGDVKKAIKKAEEDRAIIKYKALINWERLGVDNVCALIEVRLKPQRDVGFDSIAEHIYRFSQVQSTYLISGGYDLLVVITGTTMQEISTFISQKLAPLDGVEGTVTHFLLKRYKQDGEVMDGKDDPKRLPLTL